MSKIKSFLNKIKAQFSPKKIVFTLLVFFLGFLAGYLVKKSPSSFKKGGIRQEIRVIKVYKEVPIVRALNDFYDDKTPKDEKIRLAREISKYFLGRGWSNIIRDLGDKIYNEFFVTGKSITCKEALEMIQKDQERKNREAGKKEVTADDLIKDMEKEGVFKED